MEDPTQLRTSKFFDPLIWYLADAAMWGYGDSYEHGYADDDDSNGDGSGYGYALYPGDGCCGIGCGTSQLYGNIIGCGWGDGDGYGSGGNACGSGGHYYDLGYESSTF
jgi:hypothetical protein